VGAGGGVFHGAAHTFVVIFMVRDICAVPNMWGVDASGGEYNAFGVHLVIRVGME
jgi:hypothetical protein